VLSDKLNAHKVSLSSIEAGNKRMRSEIDLIRKDRMAYQSAYKNTQRDISRLESEAN
jgi:hypothetical protein